MNRVNLICLGVTSMARSLAFYKALGFETRETDENPPIVFFSNRGSALELFPLEELARDIDADNPPALSPGGFPGFTLAVNVQSEAEVDEFFARALDAGATLAKQPTRVFWGGYSGYFQDPDGYYWEVAYGPDFSYDDNGLLVL